MITDLIISRLKLRKPERYEQIRKDMVSARMGKRLDEYLREMILLSVVAGFLLSLVFVVVTSVIDFEMMTIGIYDTFHINVLLRSIDLVPFLLIQTIGTIMAFILATILFYQLAMYLPSMTANNRARAIDVTLHNSVSYLYSMRRGGTEILEIFRSLSENADIYGEVALEFRQIIRDCEYFGYDILYALRDLSDTTPSDKLRDFVNDLVSVIESGGNVTSFLSTRVTTYQDEAKFEQKSYLNTLQLIAEAYVTVFIAGPLFIIIIMVVMGLLGTEAIMQFTLVTYILIPIGALMFILMVDMISIKDTIVKRYQKIKILDIYERAPLIEGPDEKANYKKLEKYDKNVTLRGFFKDPLRWFTLDINRIFYFSIPVALVYIGWVLFTTPTFYDPELYYTAIDEHIIIAVLVVLVPYALVHNHWSKKIRGIETGLPNFLERLASINRVGMTITGAIDVLTRANLGMISSEVTRIKRDLDWGGNLSDALIRFEERVQTPAVARIVTLITKANQVSGEISDVLSIASSEARMNETLKKERNGEMILYTAIVYLSFIVFMFVVFTLSTQFLDVIGEMASPTNIAASSGSGFGNVSSVPVDSFSRLLFHTCIIQAFFAGLIAGQMGENSLGAGVKHSAVMLIIALIFFVLFV